MPAPVLITIPVSHYCERARWALEHSGLLFREEQHLQAFHYLRIRNLREGLRTVPVLDLGERVLVDSSEIVRHADAVASNGRKLYPEDTASRTRIEAFERHLVDVYGVETRRRAYLWFFRMGVRGLVHNDGRAPLWQRASLRAAYPLLRGVLTRKLGVEPAYMEGARRVVEQTWDEVEKLLSDGRPYLFGEAFSAADLTMCALSAPEFLPPEYGHPLPELTEIPETVAASIRQARERPVGQYVLRTYRTMRAPTGNARARHDVR